MKFKNNLRIMRGSIFIKDIRIFCNLVIILLSDVLLHYRYNI